MMVDMLKERTNSVPVVHRVEIVFPAGSVRHASEDELEARIRSATKVESQARSVRVEAAAELRRRRGRARTERAVREHSGQSTRGSRAEVETAEKLRDLPGVRKAFGNGEITFGHAKIIADTAERANINEGKLVDLAKEQPVDVFARTARRHEQEQSGDDGASRLEQQRQARKAGIRVDVSDGMTVLWARFDPITGQRIRNILSSETNKMWREEDPKQRLTPQQRMADALADLLCSPGKGRKAKKSGADLLLIASYDTKGQQIRDARLADGTPVPVAAFRDMACEGKVVPAVFDTQGQPLWVGRGKRLATPGQRLALIARDRRCVGCGADPAWCQAHHIVPWSADGPTDMENLCLLCSRCHHRVHDENWQIHRTPEGKYVMSPPVVIPNRRVRRRSMTVLRQ